MILVSASRLTARKGWLGCSDFFRIAKRQPLAFVGGAILALLVIQALAAPLYAGDPFDMVPLKRLQPPSAALWFGSDNLGRDVFARTAFGAQISLLVGLVCSIGVVLGGLLIGVVAGYSRTFDNVFMRIMDGLMAIPTMLLAIALVSLTRPGVGILIIAITVPQIPGVARLVRSVVLSVRERPYVEAAICGGARLPKVLWRHVLPSTIPPLIVQSAYISASAILTEAGLSFLGAGVPPEIPSWGNMISSSRLYLPIAPWTVFAPGLYLAVLVLAVNLVGDGLREVLDPRSQRRR
ncbi:peptide ABC transporter permease [Bradyrhizobium canariense]|uniref:ABC transporter permease n=1 Tax=Bradyrhizobium canariense TaxID=255045 RepID=UPI000A1982F6|nr:ABC transporter permease [Bradyrhizobium canariense]OSI76104.1 peptide ABC transporter permease [Bradyrhizobium canariense]